MAKIQYDTNIKKEADKAKVTIDVKVKPEEYARIWEMAAEKYAQNVSMPGFRKGKVPVSAVRGTYSNQISEMAFNDMVNSVAQDVISTAEDKPISTVRIDVVPHEHKEDEAEHDHNIEFTLAYAYRVSPKLPDLTNIKVNKPEINVSEDEIKQSLDMLLKSVNASPAKEGEDKKELTDWNEESVKSLGIKDVETVDQLRDLVKSEVEKQKSYEKEMEYRAAILDEIIKNTDIVIPQIVIEDMMSQQEQDYRARIEKLGFEFNQYIAEKNVNMDELRKEWEKMIKDDLSRELVLSQYVVDNNIQVSEDDIDQAEKTVDPQLKERYTPEGLRQYLRYVIANNTAFSKIYGIVSQE